MPYRAKAQGPFGIKQSNRCYIKCASRQLTMSIEQKGKQAYSEILRGGGGSDDMFPKYFLKDMLHDSGKRVSRPVS